MQVIQAIFGCIGVIFMILGAFLMMRKSPRLNEAFDAAAQARGCESEHQACYEVALFCLEAAFLFVLVSFVASYVATVPAVVGAIVVLVVGLAAGAFATKRRIDWK